MRKSTRNISDKFLDIYDEILWIVGLSNTIEMKFFNMIYLPNCQESNSYAKFSFWYKHWWISKVSFLRMILIYFCSENLFFGAPQENRLKCKPLSWSVHKWGWIYQGFRESNKLRDVHRKSNFLGFFLNFGTRIVNFGNISIIFRRLKSQKVLSQIIQVLLRF